MYFRQHVSDLTDTQYENVVNYECLRLECAFKIVRVNACNFPPSFALKVCMIYRVHFFSNMKSPPLNIDP